MKLIQFTLKLTVFIFFVSLATVHAQYWTDQKSDGYANFYNPFDRETYRQNDNPFDRETYRQGPTWKRFEW